MIYFDNAATSFPKPQGVQKAMEHFFDYYGANPGRSGHKLSMQTSQKMFDCREKVKDLFHAQNASQIVFTQNCTQALNIVILGLLKPGDHCILTTFEHNSVIRPIHELSLKEAISYDVAPVFLGDDDKTVSTIEAMIQENTKLIVTTHASNLCGAVLPIEKIAQVAKKHGVYYLVDAAQSAGMLPIDVQKIGIDFLACPGHKGLYGPTGTGILVVSRPEALSPVYAGGTGSNSKELTQPAFSPDRFECGTINTAGILGLEAGVDFVQREGIDAICAHETALLQRIYSQLKEMKKVTLYTPYPQYHKSAPVLMFNVQGISAETLVQDMSDQGICLRGGLHCAPLAHRYFGTLSSGAVRLSPGFFNTLRECDQFVDVLQKMLL